MNAERHKHMWSGFDAELRHQWEVIREMVALQHQAPTREWPLIFVEDHDALLVVREWPNGSITSYALSNLSRLKRERPPDPKP
jgi:hypothetical protein